MKQHGQIHVPEGTLSDRRGATQIARPINRTLSTQRGLQTLEGEAAKERDRDLGFLGVKIILISQDFSRNINHTTGRKNMDQVLSMN